ncbi:MAG: 30S ribosomal protein S6 [bacterium]
MQGYELTMIFNPALGEERIGSVVTKMEEKIKGWGGEELKTEKWGIKPLSSVMRKAQTLKQAYYVMIHFTSQPDLPAKVSSLLKVTENILRYSVHKIVIQPPPPRRRSEEPVAAVNVGEIAEIPDGDESGQS